MGKEAGVTKLNNWMGKHDITTLAYNIGHYFTGYLEFTPEDGGGTSWGGFCEQCQNKCNLIVPTKRKKEQFRSEMKGAMRGSPSNISPLFNHFWFHARCSKCGADVALMRS